MIVHQQQQPRIQSTGPYSPQTPGGISPLPLPFKRQSQGGKLDSLSIRTDKHDPVHEADLSQGSDFGQEYLITPISPSASFNFFSTASEGIPLPPSGALSTSTLSFSSPEKDWDSSSWDPNYTGGAYSLNHSGSEADFGTGPSTGKDIGLDTPSFSDGDQVVERGLSGWHSERVMQQPRQPFRSSVGTAAGFGMGSEEQDHNHIGNNLAQANISPFANWLDSNNAGPSAQNPDFPPSQTLHQSVSQLGLGFHDNLMPNQPGFGTGNNWNMPPNRPDSWLRRHDSHQSDYSASGGLEDQMRSQQNIMATGMVGQTPVVDGRTGYVPGGYSELAELLASGPIRRGYEEQAQGSSSAGASGSRPHSGSTGDLYGADAQPMIYPATPGHGRSIPRGSAGMTFPRARGSFQDDLLAADPHRQPLPTHPVSLLSPSLVARQFPGASPAQLQTLMYLQSLARRNVGAGAEPSVMELDQANDDPDAFIRRIARQVVHADRPHIPPPPATAAIMRARHSHSGSMPNLPQPEMSSVWNQPLSNPLDPYYPVPPYAADSAMMNVPQMAIPDLRMNYQHITPAPPTVQLPPMPFEPTHPMIPGPEPADDSSTDMFSLLHHKQKYMSDLRDVPRPVNKARAPIGRVNLADTAVNNVSGNAWLNIAMTNGAATHPGIYGDDQPFQWNQEVTPNSIAPAAISNIAISPPASAPAAYFPLPAHPSPAAASQSGSSSQADNATPSEHYNGMLSPIGGEARAPWMGTTSGAIGLQPVTEETNNFLGPPPALIRRHTDSSVPVDSAISNETEDQVNPLHPSVSDPTKTTQSGGGRQPKQASGSGPGPVRTLSGSKKLGRPPLKHKSMSSGDAAGKGKGRKRRSTVPGPQDDGSAAAGAEAFAAGHSKKLTIACQGCREKKLKCSGEKPLCSNCKRKGFFTCEYEDTVRRRGPGKKRVSKAGNQEEGMMDEAEFWDETDTHGTQR